jgi:acetylornithine deacetylase/succinyl-diaminopimelate desuccinylase-like protein
MRGGIRWQITVHGKAAHSSTPHLGVSAISYVLRAALALEANPFAGKPHDLLGHPIVSIAGIQSGPPSNIVPDLCIFDVGVRRIPGNDADAMEARLRELLEDVRVSSGLPVQLKVQRILEAPALETDRDHSLVQATLAAVAEATGREAIVRGFPGGTDALVLTPSYNAPFVIVGPGKFEQAHQTNEYVDVAELETATRAYIGIAERLLNG